MAPKRRERVKLTETDFLILGKLREGRNLAANIALEIDRARNYVNQRMPYLLDYGLVDRVGPMENSGLYQLTEKGRLAYEHRGQYFDEDVDFEELLEAELGSSDGPD